MGDILTIADGTTAPVTYTYGEQLDEPVIVYNFEVSDFHTYYVTDTGVLVHNATQSLKGIGSCSVSSKNNSQKSKYKEFDVDTYENLTKPSGDNLSAHELLQNAWLEANGKINKRKTGISLQNPAMALREDPYHKAITAMQNHNKMNKNTLKGTSWQSNVHQNIKFMVQAGVPREKILELAKATIRFAKEHKL